MDCSARVSTTQSERNMQIQGAPEHPVQYNSMVHCCGKMLQEEGISAFWRGTTSSFMKVWYLCAVAHVFRHIPVRY